MNGYGTSISLGRWMLEILESLFSIICGCSDVPVIHVLISLFLISATAIISSKVLVIDDWVSKLYIGLVLITFPTVSSIFAYMFTAHIYFLACFLAALFVYLVRKEKKNYALIAIILLAVSLGIYQAFIGVSIVLTLLSILNDCINDEEGMMEIKRLIRYVVCGIVSVLLYCLITFISLKITGKKLGEYQGIDNIGNNKVSDLIRTVLHVYIDFFRSYWNGINESRVIRIITLIVILITFIIAFILCLKTKCIVNRVVGSVVLLLLPLALNVMKVLSVNSKTDVHTLMRYSLAFTYIFPVVVLRNYVKNSNIKNSGLLLVLMIILWIFPCMYMYTDNRAYVKMTLLQEQANSYFVSLESKIKNVEGYDDDLPIAFVGEGKVIDKTFASSDFEKDAIITGYAYTLDSLINDYAWRDYMEERIGFRPKEVADISKVQEMEIVAQMPSYPDDGSIVRFDDMIIVKLSNIY